jgi:hypothetical protein
MKRLDPLRRGCAVALLIVALSPGRGALAAESEAIALELLFEGVAPCLTSAELADAVAERSGQPIATDAADPPLAIHVRVRPAATRAGFDVTIESRERGAGEPGMRALQVAGGCETLASPLSLVIALMVGNAQTGLPQPSSETLPAPDAQTSATQAVPAAVPAPSAPPPHPLVPSTPTPSTPRSNPPPQPPPRPSVAPARPAIPHEKREETGERWTFSLGGGADLGAVPGPTPLVAAAVRFEFSTPATNEGAVRGAWEVAAEYLSSPEVDESGWKASVDGAGLQGLLCAIWQRGWFAFEPCAGLWLRSLRIAGEGEAAALFQPRRTTITGWGTRALLRAQVSGPWSVFAGLQALAPFGSYRLTLEPRPDAPAEELDGPFFNATSGEPAPIVGRTLSPVRLDLYDVPVFAAVLLAGVTFTL